MVVASTVANNVIDTEIELQKSDNGIQLSDNLSINDANCKHHHDEAPKPGASNIVSNSPNLDSLSTKAAVNDPNDRRLLRKLDLHLIPPMTILYLLNYLDRVNIGQAKLNGITTTLHLSSAQYNACLSIVYVTYVAFEMPSNLILKKLRPSRWIPLIMVTWGIVTTLTGLANSYGALLACRLLLGAPEAGLFPGNLV